jgi:hypothetical protein
MFLPYPGKIPSERVFESVMYTCVTKVNFTERSRFDRIHNQPRFFKSDKVSFTVLSSEVGLKPRILLSFSLLNVTSWVTFDAS